jgi:competence protein ComEA
MDRPAPDTAVTRSPPLPMSAPELPSSEPAPGFMPIPSPSAGSWPRSAQWTVAALLLCVTVLLGIHAFAGLRASTRPSEHVERDGPLYRLDLNRAGTAELAQLEGVGPKLAERIVAHRRQQGPFRTVGALRQVSGIGPKTFARIQPWVCVEAGDDTGEAVKSPGRREPARQPVMAARRASSKKEAALAGALINVNEASAAELQRLPRIGPVLSQRIIEERNRARFRSVDELRRVKGIGPKTLENLRPFVTVENPALAAAQP